MKVVVLDNIRSAHNVGSIFRTSDGAGVDKLYLCGYTPTPVDRFGRPQPEITKTSLSATDSVAWEYFESIVELITSLKDDGFYIVAVEQTPQSVDYRTKHSADKIAYVLGNEIEGVNEAVITEADAVVEIPMQGQKESLNVSVTAGVILFNT